MHRYATHYAFETVETTTKQKDNSLISPGKRVIVCTCIRTRNKIQRNSLDKIGDKTGAPRISPLPFHWFSISFILLRSNWIPWQPEPVEINHNSVTRSTNCLGDGIPMDNGNDECQFSLSKLEIKKKNRKEGWINRVGKIDRSLWCKYYRACKLLSRNVRVILQMRLVSICATYGNKVNNYFG